MDYFFDVFTTLLSGVFALSGVLIGAKLAEKQANKKYRKDQELSACVEFLSTALSSLKEPPENHSEMASRLAFSTAKIQLLCSERISSLAMRISDQIIQENINHEVLGILINEFIESAKQKPRDS